MSATSDDCERRRSPTDTSYRLSLVVDLITEEVPLADDDDSEHCSTDHRSPQSTQKQRDRAVDPLHLPDGGTIRTLDRHVIALIFIWITEARLPVDLQDLNPSRY